MFTDDQAREALSSLNEQNAASRRKTGVITAINGRTVSVLIDGGGTGIVSAYRGIFNPSTGVGVTIERVAGTTFWKVVGIRDTALGNTNNGRYDFENEGVQLYYPLALEAINDVAYSFGDDLDVTLFNIQFLSSTGTWEYIDSLLLDMTPYVPTTESCWGVVYIDLSDDTIKVYTHTPVPDPEGLWHEAVTGLLATGDNVFPLLAIWLNSGMTEWGDAWRVIKRGLSFAGKRVVRIPFQPDSIGGGSTTGSIIVTDTATTVDPATALSLDPAYFEVTDGGGTAQVTFIGASGGADELSELTDVDVVSTPPTDGQVLTFDDSDNLWKPSDPSGSGSIATTDGTTTVNPTTLLDVDPTFFDLTDLGSGTSGLTFVGEASDIPYTPTSPLTATDVQGALDELAAGGSGGDVVVTRALKTTQTQLWLKTLSSTGTFDTNNADDTGRAAPNWTGYSYLIVRLHIKSDANANNVGGALWLNNDTTNANYRTTLSVSAAAATVSNTQPADNSLLYANGAGTGGSPANTWVDNEIVIPDVNNTAVEKNLRNTIEGVRSTTQLILGIVGLWWKNTAAITRLNAVPIGGSNWVAGSYMEVIGVKEEYVVSNVTGGVLGGSVDFAALTDDTTPVPTDYALLDDGTNKKSTLANILKLANAEVTTTSTGNIDDFAIGTAPVTLLRMNNASDATLRGLAAGVGGQVVLVESVGAGNVYLAYENAGSVVANRLRNTVTTANTPLAAGKGKAVYVYDGSSNRWRLTSHVQGDYIAYTPTWKGSTTNPTIGNGTLSGRYLIHENFCRAEIYVEMGSTTTFGSGNYNLTAPVPISAPLGTFAALLGISRMRDDSAGGLTYMGLININAGEFRTTAHNAVPNSNLAPFTWAQSDSWYINVDYAVG